MTHLYVFFLLNSLVGLLLSRIWGVNFFLWIAMGVEALLTVLIAVYVHKKYSHLQVMRRITVTDWFTVGAISFWSSLTPVIIDQLPVTQYVGKGVYALDVLPHLISVSLIALVLIAWRGTIYSLETG